MQADIDVLLSSRDVDGLLRALQLGGESKRRRNISARRRAAEALETLRAKETAPALAHALEYDVFSVARAAGQALARIGAAALEPLWEAASSSGGTSIPRRVERALQRMLNVPVEKWLLEKMQEDDEWSRETASRLLGGVGGNAAVKALDTARRRDFDTSVRQAAVVSLGRIGGQATIAPLVSALGDEDWDTRQLALRLLLDRSPFPLDAVLAELREGETRARGFAALALALAGIRDSRVVEPLLALLGQEDVTARERAAVALGSLGDERAVPPLLERLQDEAVTVRYGAAKALQQIRERTALITWETQEAEQVLQSSLESLLAQVDGEELQPCFDAATLLGWFREEQAVDALNRALDDHYKEQTHAYIIKALARIGSPGATRQLCRRLSEESWERRSDVVRSLWVTGSPEVAPALQGLCDEDDLVREEAFRALDWLDGRGLLSRFLRESSGKHAAVEAWRKSGQEASLDGLLVALESDEPPEHQARETREARDPAEQHEGATPAAAASGHRDRERSSWRPAFLFLAFYSLLCFLNHWFYELQTGLEWDIFRGWNAFPLLVGTLAGLVPLFFLFTMLRHGLGMLLDSESDEPEPTASVPATHVGMAGAVCASTVALAVMEWVAFEKAFRDILTEPVVFYPRWGSLDVSHVVHVALLTIVTGLLLYAGMLSVLWLFLSCKGLLGKAPRLRLLRLTAYPLLTCAALYFFATDITRNLSREAAPSRRPKQPGNSARSGFSRRCRFSWMPPATRMRPSARPPARRSACMPAVVSGRGRSPPRQSGR
ncbi:MAG: HEAT repeat domain-containing protein [Planctomycetota bacterium]